MPLLALTNMAAPIRVSGAPSVLRYKNSYLQAARHQEQVFGKVC
jgi:hypothetical protein